MRRIFIDIFYFLLLQIFGWGGFFVLRSYGINYIDKYLITTAYFILLCILYMYLIKKEFSQYLFLPNKKEITSLLLLFSSLIISYLYFTPGLRIPNFLELYPTVYFLSFDFRYLLTKTFEILFQQLTIVFLVLLLHSKKVSFKKIALVFAIIFPLLHLTNFLYMPFSFALTLFIGSIVASILFPYIILKYKDGFIYTYVLHWGFYLLVDLSIAMLFMFK